MVLSVKSKIQDTPTVRDRILSVLQQDFDNGTSGVFASVVGATATLQQPAQMSTGLSRE